MTQPSKATQIVAFYDTDDGLSAQLASFFAEGQRRGEVGVLLTTRTRWDAISKAVRRVSPVDLDLQFIDADGVLTESTVNGAIDVQRLLSALQGAIRRGERVRFFGDLVSLLAQRGELDVALEFEFLGHQFAREAEVAVLCGYDLRHLDPNCRDQDIKRIEALHEASPHGSTGIDARKPVVLIAEDFADAREMYAQFLCASGFAVIETDNGEDAVAAATQHSPDIVLMDIRMPRISGIEALRLLRSDPRTRHLRIIALTAHALESERKAIMAAGFDAMLSKPCLPTDLVSVVRQTMAAPTNTA